MGKIIRHFILFLVERSLSFYSQSKNSTRLQYVTWGGVLKLPEW